jgi:hypothetical protein
MLVSKGQEIWRKIPLHRAVLEVIMSRPEGIMESKLVEILKKEYDIEVSTSELYNVLMKCELGGLIQVYHVGKEFLIKPVIETIKTET